MVGEKDVGLVEFIGNVGKVEKKLWNATNFYCAW